MGIRERAFEELVYLKLTTFSFAGNIASERFHREDYERMNTSSGEWRRKEIV